MTGGQRRDRERENNNKKVVSSECRQDGQRPEEATRGSEEWDRPPTLRYVYLIVATGTKEIVSAQRNSESQSEETFARRSDIEIKIPNSEDSAPRF